MLGLKAFLAVYSFMFHGLGSKFRDVTNNCAKFPQVALSHIGFRACQAAKRKY